MVLVALSSNPFIHKKPASQAPAAPQLVKPCVTIPEAGNPGHEPNPIRSHNSGTNPQMRRTAHVETVAFGV
jgi:hypothetical protein